MTALYVLGAILVLLVLGVMVAPLFREEGPAEEIGSLPPRERREAALEAVRDLRFEHETGKLGDEEYRQLRSHYGRMVLDAEDELEAAGEPVPEGGGEARERVASARGKPDEPPEAPGERSSACPECGEAPEAPARYCPRCGARLPGAAGGDG